MAKMVVCFCLVHPASMYFYTARFILYKVSESWKLPSVMKSMENIFKLQIQKLDKWICTLKHWAKTPNNSSLKLCSVSSKVCVKKLEI